MQVLEHFSFSSDFMPHGYCYLWNPTLIWLHVLSDGLIFAAYQSIPFTLIYFARQRRDLPYRWMFWLFGAFIVSCGFTHGMEIWTLWHADYWLSGAVKAVTAVASVSTAILLVKLVPQAVTLSSPGAATPGWTAVQPRFRASAHRRLWLAYGLAAATTAATLLAIIAAGTGIATNTPVIVFMIPILLGAYIGGLIPGLVTTALSVLCSVYFTLPPLRSFRVASPADNVKWVTLLVAGLFVSMMSEALVSARANAQTEQARLAAIIGSAMDGIVAVDRHRRITLFNPAAEEIFGCRAAEALGRPLTRFIPELVDSAQGQQIQISGRSGLMQRSASGNNEFRGRREDGTEFPIEASISRVELAGGRLFTVVLRDITERKRAEDALAQRTKELARSNADLEQFAYVASHDLKEPLRAVAGCVQLLQRRCEGKLDARSEEFIAHAIDGASRMQHLIEDLLTFSRVGTRGGKFELVECGEALKAALQNLAAAVQDSGAVVTADPLPTIKADATQLASLFQNLIGNALKFRGTDPPQIHVGARSSDGQWMFSVRDNGIGIDSQYFERIFGVFQRLHARREYPGTGIGLAVCKKIVERHGGRIWVESEPGKGATFYFAFPGSAGA